MRAALLLAAAGLVGGAPEARPTEGRPPVPDPPAVLHHPPRPPARFLKDGAVAVAGFADEDSVEALCLDGEAPQPRRRVLACVFRRDDGTAVMILPNPCRYGGFYAELACHEMGHVSGWGSRHGR